MNKWLEYHEAVERRIMEMMRPDAPNPMYEQGWQDYTQGRYRKRRDSLRIPPGCTRRQGRPTV